MELWSWLSHSSQDSNRILTVLRLLPLRKHHFNWRKETHLKWQNTGYSVACFYIFIVLVLVICSLYFYVWSSELKKLITLEIKALVPKKYLHQLSGGQISFCYHVKHQTHHISMKYFAFEKQRHIWEVFDNLSEISIFNSDCNSWAHSEFYPLLDRKELRSTFSLVTYFIRKVIVFYLHARSSQRPRMVRFG